MEPSHCKIYEPIEIERITGEILDRFYPNVITIPIAIDTIVEKHPAIDSIGGLELLEDKFNVIGVTYWKENGKFDIIIDEDVLNYQKNRANFSIAHEYAHIELHLNLWKGCKEINHSIDMHKRISRCYNDIEKNADYFAGAILIPRITLNQHLPAHYRILTAKFGFASPDLIIDKLKTQLANFYKVSVPAMEIRLKQLKFYRPIQQSVQYRLCDLDFTL